MIFECKQQNSLNLDEPSVFISYGWIQSHCIYVISRVRHYFSQGTAFILLYSTKYNAITFTKKFKL